MLERVRFIDIEGQIFLQLWDLDLQSMALLEVILTLSLKCGVWLHQVIIKLDKLFHLCESVASNLGWVAYFVFVCAILLRVLVAGSKRLILTRKHHDSLLELNLRLQFCLVCGINLVPLQIEVNSNKICKLLQRADLLSLHHLLGGKHLLKLLTDFGGRFVFLDWNKATKLRS
jgi:hypothetical protein